MTPIFSVVSNSLQFSKPHSKPSKAFNEIILPFLWNKSILFSEYIFCRDNSYHIFCTTYHFESLLLRTQKIKNEIAVVNRSMRPNVVCVTFGLGEYINDICVLCRVFHSSNLFLFYSNDAFSMRMKEKTNTKTRQCNPIASKIRHKKWAHRSVLLLSFTHCKHVLVTTVDYFERVNQLSLSCGAKFQHWTTKKFNIDFRDVYRQLVFTKHLQRFCYTGIHFTYT